MSKKIEALSVKKGMVIEYANSLYTVTDTHVTKPGKGGAFIQIFMKDHKSTIKKRFRTEEKLNQAEFEEFEAKFLYSNQRSCFFYELEAGEIIECESSLRGAEFLQSDCRVKLRKYDDRVVSFQFIESVKMKIVEVQPSLKGETVTSSYKNALLENGISVMVPQYINECMYIVINPETREFKEKWKG